MSDTVYGGYRHATNGATAVTDWYLNLIATYGWFPVITAELVLLIGAVVGGWALIEHIEERTQRKDGIDQLESYVNHPANRSWKEEL